jgi:hypothetical protein
MAGALATLAAIDVSAATSSEAQRRIDCMNYFKDHLQQVSGTPFVKQCLASSETIPALAARLQAAKSPQAPEDACRRTRSARTSRRNASGIRW